MICALRWCCWRWGRWCLWVGVDIHKDWGHLPRCNFKFAGLQDVQVGSEPDSCSFLVLKASEDGAIIVFDHDFHMLPILQVSGRINIYLPVENIYLYDVHSKWHSSNTDPSSMEMDGGRNQPHRHK
jgi:hypothetical protein